MTSRPGPGPGLALSRGSVCRSSQWCRRTAENWTLTIAPKPSSLVLQTQKWGLTFAECKPAVRDGQKAARACVNGEYEPAVGARIEDFVVLPSSCV